ncbi:small integral membrane protein 24 [Diceros bicornis minor]|uniref:small integral membrane protein 24 n=1 Tax=Diceros bicornis minor TaxID=77932 RepID=UPI0026ED2B38|nr:small integral membrane protein 24 [Diceros bicornis minor]
MNRFWTTPGRLSLLAALVARPVQAQPLAQRKPWLVGLGAALACLFLLFVLALAHAIWCRGSRDSDQEKEEETVRKEEKEEEDDWGLELEEKRGACGP